MAKVVLVYLPVTFGKKESLGLPPLGLLYIATFLKEKGVQVKVIDACIQGHTLKELTEEILRENPDVIGFSAMTCQVRTVLEIVRELKMRKCSSKIVVGGHHVNATRQELFEFSSDIDFLFYGEGEKEFFNFVKAVDEKRSFEDVRGLIYKKDSRVIVNPPPELTQNLDELPFPDLSLVDFRRYDIYYAKSLPLTSLLASRGCPHNCIYCSASMVHGKRFRLRSPANVVDEMESNYKKHRIRQFVIKDSTFTADKAWIYDICSEIQKRKLKINWCCNTRADLLDEELLKVMKKSGCYFIAFGIESGSQKILDVLRKGITIEKIKKGISLCKKVDIGRTGTFMIGNPTETEEDAQKTLRFIKELDLDLALALVTIAYPGTAIYFWAVQEKVLSDKFWYMKENHGAFTGGWEMNGSLNMGSFPREKVMEMVKKANRSFYGRPSFVWKRVRMVRGLADIKRNFMSLKKLLWKG